MIFKIRVSFCDIQTSATDLVIHIRFARAFEMSAFSGPMKGCAYACQAVEMILAGADPGASGIYRRIAEANGVSPKNVERSLRRALEKAWTSHDGIPPTNLEFFRMVAERAGR